MRGNEVTNPNFILVKGMRHYIIAQGKNEGPSGSIAFDAASLQCREMGRSMR